MTTAKKAPFTVYQPTNTKNWYVSFSVKGQGQKRIALRTSDKEQATILAEAIWERENNAPFLDNTQTKMIPQIVDEFISAEKVSPSEKTTLKRYIAEYWRYNKPDIITKNMIANFIKWRKSYWINNASQDGPYIEYERDGKIIRRAAKKTAPSETTLTAERSTLRKLLKYCYKKKYISTLPSFPASPKIERTKPVAFTDSDIRYLFEYLRSAWDQKPVNSSKTVDVKYRYSELMTFLYFDVLRTTGITPRECNNLKWDDLIGYDFEPSYNEINIPQNVKIKVRQKNKTRIVIPLNGFGQMLILLKSLQKRRGLETSAQYIWRDRTGKRSDNLGEKILAAIKKCHLDLDGQGNIRNLDSIRIHYIMSVIDKVGYVDMVAENVGLTLNALEKLTGIEYRRLTRSKEVLRVSPTEQLIPYVRNTELLPYDAEPD